MPLNSSLRFYPQTGHRTLMSHASSVNENPTQMVFSLLVLVRQRLTCLGFFLSLHLLSLVYMNAEPLKANATLVITDKALTQDQWQCILKSDATTAPSIIILYSTNNGELAPTGICRTNTDCRLLDLKASLKYVKSTVPIKALPLALLSTYEKLRVESNIPFSKSLAVLKSPRYEVGTCLRSEAGLQSIPSAVREVAAAETLTELATINGQVNRAKGASDVVEHSTQNVTGEPCNDARAIHSSSSINQLEANSFKECLLLHSANDELVGQVISSWIANGFIESAVRLIVDIALVNQSTAMAISLLEKHIFNDLNSCDGYEVLSFLYAKDPTKPVSRRSWPGKCVLNSSSAVQDDKVEKEKKISSRIGTGTIRLEAKTIEEPISVPNVIPELAARASIRENQTAIKLSRGTIIALKSLLNVRGSSTLGYLLYLLSQKVNGPLDDKAKQLDCILEAEEIIQDAYEYGRQPFLTAMKALDDEKSWDYLSRRNGVWRELRDFRRTGTESSIAIVMDQLLQRQGLSLAGGSSMQVEDLYFDSIIIPEDVKKSSGIGILMTKATYTNIACLRILILHQESVLSIAIRQFFPSGLSDVVQQAATMDSALIHSIAQSRFMRELVFGLWLAKIGLKQFSAIESESRMVGCPIMDEMAHTIDCINKLPVGAKAWLYCSVFMQDLPVGSTTRNALIHLNVGEPEQLVSFIQNSQRVRNSLSYCLDRGDDGISDKKGIASFRLRNSSLETYIATLSPFQLYLLLLLSKINKESDCDPQLFINAIEWIKSSDQAEVDGALRVLTFARKLPSEHHKRIVSIVFENLIGGAPQNGNSVFRSLGLLMSAAHCSLMNETARLMSIKLAFDLLEDVSQGKSGDMSVKDVEELLGYKSTDLFTTKLQACADRWGYDDSIVARLGANNEWKSLRGERRSTEKKLKEIQPNSIMIKEPNRENEASGTYATKNSGSTQGRVLSRLTRPEWVRFSYWVSVLDRELVSVLDDSALGEWASNEKEPHWNRNVLAKSNIVLIGEGITSHPLGLVRILMLASYARSGSIWTRSKGMGNILDTLSKYYSTCLERSSSMLEYAGEACGHLENRMSYLTTVLEANAAVVDQLSHL